MHVSRLAGAFVALALLFPATAAAQFGLGPRFTWVHSDVGTETSADRYTGGVLRAHMSPRTSVELAFDWRTITNESLNVRTKDYPLQASLLLYPFNTPVTPYLLGGVGWYWQSVEPLDTSQTGLESISTRNFGYHAGLGGELRLGRHAAVHVDYRYTKIRFGDDEPDVDTEAGSGGLTIPGVSYLADRLNLSYEGSMWTGGLTLYF
jgi:opacity protein-like surface antigen